MIIDELILKWEKEADKFHKIVEKPKFDSMRLPAIAIEDKLRDCIKELKQVKNNISLGDVVNRFVMCKSWFKIDRPTIDSEYLIAECPCCGGIVYYSYGCENCKSDFIFND